MKLLEVLEQKEDLIIGKFSTVKGGFIIVETKTIDGKNKFSYNAHNSNIKSHQAIHNKAMKASKILREMLNK